MEVLPSPHHFAMPNEQPTLPSYEAPPLVEVVFGRQFDSLPITAAHTGLLWEKLGREAFPLVQEQPPLPPVIEVFGESTTAVIDIGDVLTLPRLWFGSSNHDALVQLQRDRFLVNWRAGGLPYPRYATLFPRFENLWQIFESFVGSELKVTPTSRQLELTYVNHIPWLPDWNHLGTALGSAFPDVAWRAAPRFLAEPDTADLRLAVRLPATTGRLHIRIRDAKRKVDGARLFILEITARGFDDPPRRWFDVAHEWIVRGFADLTSNEIQEQTWLRRS